MCILCVLFLENKTENTNLSTYDAIGRYFWLNCMKCELAALDKMYCEENVEIWYWKIGSE